MRRLQTQQEQEEYNLLEKEKQVLQASRLQLSVHTQIHSILNFAAQDYLRMVEFLHLQTNKMKNLQCPTTLEGWSESPSNHVVSLSVSVFIQRWQYQH